MVNNLIGGAEGMSAFTLTEPLISGKKGNEMKTTMRTARLRSAAWAVAMVVALVIDSSSGLTGRLVVPPAGTMVLLR